jgi:dTDP-4-amino-4,6-dideoxygalactose transaminase
MAEKYIPFFVPTIGNEEIREVAKVMKSGWITSGHVTEQFEKEFRKYTGCKYTAAVNSGTAALHLALDAIGLRPDDEVITTPMTFAATAEVILYFHARPVFVDCKRDTFNIDEHLLEEKITQHTKAILPVHFAGQPCRMDTIFSIARKYNLRVIADAAHAIPAKFKGGTIGALSDLTAFSFYANKNITTGEGGMISTNNKKFIDRIRMMRLHGITQDAWKRYQRGGSWQYEIHYPGFKYNLTDIASAIGIVQLKKCDAIYKRRLEVVNQYLEELRHIEEIKLPVCDPDVQHAWHLFVIQLELEKLKINRAEFIKKMNAKNIGVSVHFISLHLHPYYRHSFNYRPEDFPNAAFLSQRVVSLPVYPKLTQRDIRRVVKAVEDIITTSRKSVVLYGSKHEGIPLSNPDITDLERNYVNEVLQTPYLSLGPKLHEFEQQAAQYLGAQYAIAVNSGTSALHMALRAHGLQEGDTVITTPFSFISSASCLLYEKIKPVFIDIEDRYYNISPEKIERFMKKTSKDVRSSIKAILAVDVFGHPANWNELRRIAKQYGLLLIEDSSEALGSEYRLRGTSRQQGKWVKAGLLGDIGIISFYPNKQITTGEGGMIVTNNRRISDICKSIKNQGRDVKENPEYPFIRLGYNYRMSDINCALGIAQMERLNTILEKRKTVADHYTALLKNANELHIPRVASDVKLSWFVYVVRLVDRYTRKDRDAIIAQMARRGIACSNYFPPIHLQPFYRTMFGFKPGDFTVTERVADRTIALPFFSNLQAKEIEHVATTLKDILRNT